MKIGGAQDEGLTLIAGGRPPGLEVPRSPTEAADLSWVPDLGSAVLGGAHLRQGCRPEGMSCPVNVSHVLFHGGYVTSCHLIHGPDRGAPEAPCAQLHGEQGIEDVFIYEMNGEQQALANAVMWEKRIDKSVKLMVDDKEFTLTPDDGRLTLAIINEPVSQEKASSGHENAINMSLDHFNHHYELLRAPGSWASRVPRFTGRAVRMAPGSCEPILECLASLEGILQSGSPWRRPM